MTMLDPFEHPLPEELQDASIDRILTVMGESANGRKRGVCVSRHEPWWRVVARLNDRSRVEYIVVDVMPAMRGKAPVRVYGPVTTRQAADTWARSTAELYRATTTSAPEWPWE